jgi:hypothetical protein
MWAVGHSIPRTIGHRPISDYTSDPELLLYALREWTRLKRRLKRLDRINEALQMGPRR